MPFYVLCRVYGLGPTWTENTSDSLSMFGRKNRNSCSCDKQRFEWQHNIMISCFRGAKINGRLPLPIWLLQAWRQQKLWSVHELCGRQSLRIRLSWRTCIQPEHLPMWLAWRSWILRCRRLVGQKYCNFYHFETKQKLSRTNYLLHYSLNLIVIVLMLNYYTVWLFSVSISLFLHRIVLCGRCLSCRVVCCTPPEWQWLYSSQTFKIKGILSKHLWSLESL